MYHGILIPGSQTDIQDLLAITTGHRCQLDGKNTARTAMHLCGIAAIACELKTWPIILSTIVNTIKIVHSPDSDG